MSPLTAYPSPASGDRHDPGRTTNPKSRGSLGRRTAMETVWASHQDPDCLNDEDVLMRAPRSSRANANSVASPSHDRRLGRSRMLGGVLLDMEILVSFLIESLVPAGGLGCRLCPTASVNALISRGSLCSSPAAPAAANATTRRWASRDRALGACPLPNPARLRMAAGFPVSRWHPHQVAASSHPGDRLAGGRCPVWPRGPVRSRRTRVGASATPFS